LIPPGLPGGFFVFRLQKYFVVTPGLELAIFFQNICMKNNKNKKKIQTPLIDYNPANRDF